MRHRKANAKLNRPTDQRLAMLRELAAGVIYDTKIETTLARAKATRPYLERLVTKAIQGRKLEVQAGNVAVDEEKQKLQAAAVHLRRQVRRKLQNPALVKHLFDNVAPHYETRPGGYTRITKTGRRRGDGAEMAVLQFVD
ncbi:MAG: 50S ribosomal protein L17 [Armatimonadetes bacterium]|nr:50S ribosomal protein L17 [Armatimonadota bacterium]